MNRRDVLRRVMGLTVGAGAVGVMGTEVMAGQAPAHLFVRLDKKNAFNSMLVADGRGVATPPPDLRTPEELWLDERQELIAMVDSRIDHPEQYALCRHILRVPVGHWNQVREHLETRGMRYARATPPPPHGPFGWRGYFNVHGNIITWQ